MTQIQSSLKQSDTTQNMSVGFFPDTPLIRTLDILGKKAALSQEILGRTELI